MKPITPSVKFILVALLGIAAAFALASCGQGIPEGPVGPPDPKVPLCSAVTAGNGGITVCIDGNGNTIYINPAPTATPSGSPGVPKCEKGVPAYQENVLAAWRSIVPAQPGMKGHIAAMVAALQKAGFQATSGGTLSEDELAVKIDKFSETYDVWFGEFNVENSAQVLYVATCTPARF